MKDLGFGTNLLALLAKWDRDSLSWKTSQRSLLVELETFLGRFPTSGMMRNGELYELPTSAHRIGENGSSLWPTHVWPTPSATDGTNVSLVRTPEQWATQYEHHAANGQHKQFPLQVAATLGMSEPMATRAFWPTPTSTDHKASGAAGYSTDAAVRKLWATPTAHNSMGAPGQGTIERGGREYDLQVDVKKAGNMGKLNPVWVSQLMGFPAGWLDGLQAPAKRNTNGKRHERLKKPTAEPQNSEHLATPLCRKSRKKSENGCSK